VGHPTLEALEYLVQVFGINQLTAVAVALTQRRWVTHTGMVRLAQEIAKVAAS
jgi:hypothetical protein